MAPAPNMARIAIVGAILIGATIVCTFGGVLALMFLLHFVVHRGQEFRSSDAEVPAEARNGQESRLREAETKHPTRTG